MVMIIDLAVELILPSTDSDSNQVHGSNQAELFVCSLRFFVHNHENLKNESTDFISRLDAFSERVCAGAKFK